MRGHTHLWGRTLTRHGGDLVMMSRRSLHDLVMLWRRGMMMCGLMNRGRGL